MILRSISPFEKRPLEIESWTQLALELNNEDLIPRIIDLFNKQVIGLHLRVEGNNLIYDPNSIHVVHDSLIQSDTKLHDATEISYNNRPKPSQFLGAIHYNQNKLVLNVNHMCGDGRFLTQQLANINNIFHYKDSQVQSYITPYEVCFHDQIERAKNCKSSTMPHNTLIEAHNYEKVPHDKYFRSQVISIPCRDLQIYNQPNNAITGLNEELHTSYILSSIAFSNLHKKDLKINELLNRFGVYSNVDLRPKAERDFDTICNAFGEISINLNVSEHMSIAEINSRMKQMIKEKINSNEPFTHIPKVNTASQRDLILSNVGSLSLADHISDCWISTYGKVNASMLPLLYGYSFSVVKESQQRNDLYVCLTHDRHEFSQNDMMKIESGMKHFMTQIPLDCSVGTALRELIDFMKKQ